MYCLNKWVSRSEQGEMESEDLDPDEMESNDNARDALWEGTAQPFMSSPMRSLHNM